MSAPTIDQRRERLDTALASLAATVQGSREMDQRVGVRAGELGGLVSDVRQCSEEVLPRSVPVRGDLAELRDPLHRSLERVQDKVHHKVLELAHRALLRLGATCDATPAAGAPAAGEAAS